MKKLAESHDVSKMNEFYDNMHLNNVKHEMR